MFEPIVFVTKRILKCFCLDVLNILIFPFFWCASGIYSYLFSSETDFYSCFDLLNELKCSITWVCLRAFSLNSRILQWKFLNNYSKLYWIITAWSVSFFAVLNTSKFSMVLVRFRPIFLYFSSIYIEMFAWVYYSCFGVPSAYILIFITNVVWNKWCLDLFVFFLLIFLNLNSKSLLGSK